MRISKGMNLEEEGAVLLHESHFIALDTALDTYNYSRLTIESIDNFIGSSVIGATGYERRDHGVGTGKGGSVKSSCEFY